MASTFEGQIVYIDGECWVRTGPYGAQVNPCPEAGAATAASVLGVSGIALAVLAWVVWLGPEVARRRTQLDRIITAAERSLS